MLQHHQEFKERGGGRDGAISGGPRLGVAGVLFFVMVWWVGCFFYWGDLGAYSDDWSLARIDVITGESTMWRWPFEREYFWRPLLQLFLTIMFGAFWEHMSLFHLANVTLHAGSAVALYRLCRGMGLGRHGSYAAALVFLLFPYQYEVIFWSTAMTTGIATFVCMWLTSCVMEYGKGAEKWAGVRGLLKLSAVTFFMVCWYEQPGAVALALPMVYMAVKLSGEGLYESGARVVKMCLAIGTPMIVYIGLLVGTAPRGTRGGNESYITLSGVPARIEELLRDLPWYAMYNVKEGFLGGLSFGWKVLGESGGLNGVLILGLMGIVGGLLVLAFRDEAQRREWTMRYGSVAIDHGSSRVGGKRAGAEGKGSAKPRLRWIFAFACVVVVGSIVPVFPMRGQILEPRLSSYACIGLGVGVACCVEWAMRVSWGRAWWPLVRGSVGIGIVLAGILGSVSMLGAQGAMRNRTMADQKQATQLGELGKNALPGTVFLALDDQYLPTRTGYLAFDRRLSAWLMATWSARPVIRNAMKRWDVSASSRNMWRDLEMANCDEEGFTYTSNWPGAGEKVPGGTRLTWDVCVPFVVQADGNVLLVETVVVKRPDGSVLEVTPRRMKEMNASGVRFEIKVGK